MTINLFEHQSARSNRNSAGVKWRKAVSDQVGIDKQWTAAFIRQEFSRESGFASAVRAGNDDYAFVRHLRLPRIGPVVSSRCRRCDSFDVFVFLVASVMRVPEINVLL